MRQRELGFTLVELIIATAIVSIIAGTLGYVVMFSVRAYLINVETSEEIAKVAPVVKRIEMALTESGGTSTTNQAFIVGVTTEAALNTTTFPGLAVHTKEDKTYWYWWDKNGNGSMDANESGAPSSGVSASVFRTQFAQTTHQAIFISKGSVPSNLQSVYGSQWDEAQVVVKDFYFTFYSTDSNTKRTTLWNTSLTYGAISYVKINIVLEGTGEKATLNFSHGFKINQELGF